MAGFNLLSVQRPNSYEVTKQSQTGSCRDPTPGEYIDQVVPLLPVPAVPPPSCDPGGGSCSVYNRFPPVCSSDAAGGSFRVYNQFSSVRSSDPPHRKRIPHKVESESLPTPAVSQVPCEGRGCYNEPAGRAIEILESSAHAPSSGECTVSTYTVTSSRFSSGADGRTATSRFSGCSRHTLCSFR